MKTEKIVIDGVEHEVVSVKALNEDNDPRDVMIENLIKKVEVLAKTIEDMESKVKYHDNWIKSEIELRNFQDEYFSNIYE